APGTIPCPTEGDPPDELNPDTRPPAPPLPRKRRGRDATRGNHNRPHTTHPTQENPEPCKGAVLGFPSRRPGSALPRQARGRPLDATRTEPQQPAPPGLTW